MEKKVEIEAKMTRLVCHTPEAVIKRRLCLHLHCFSQQQQHRRLGCAATWCAKHSRVGVSYFAASLLRNLFPGRADP